MIAQAIKKEDGTFEFKNLAGGAASGLPVGSILAIHSNRVPAGYLPCNGAEFDIEQYPALYLTLKTNKLPDLRESNLVGIGERGEGITTHDVYTLGQFKDDQAQQQITGVSSTAKSTSESSCIPAWCQNLTHRHCNLIEDLCSNYPPFICSGCQFSLMPNVCPGTYASSCVIALQSCLTCLCLDPYGTSRVCTGDRQMCVCRPQVDITTTTTTCVDTSLSCNSAYRCGATTHGKNYGVFFVIKAVAGVLELDEDELYGRLVEDLNTICGDIETNLTEKLTPSYCCNLAQTCTMCNVSIVNGKLTYQDGCGCIANCVIYTGGGYQQTIGLRGAPGTCQGSIPTGLTMVSVPGSGFGTNYARLQASCYPYYHSYVCADVDGGSKLCWFFNSGSTACTSLVKALCSDICLMSACSPSGIYSRKGWKFGMDGIKTSTDGGSTWGSAFDSLRIPSPNGNTCYHKIRFLNSVSRCNSAGTILDVQVYGSSYKVLPGTTQLIGGVGSYGLSCTAFVSDATNGDYYWLKTTGWREFIVSSCYGIKIEESTTTEPTGVTWRAPTGLSFNGSTSLTCTVSGCNAYCMTGPNMGLSLAIGRGAQASGNYGIVIGTYACSNTSAIAIGNSDNNSTKTCGLGSNSIAIGNCAYTGGAGSIAIGCLARACAADAIVIGKAACTNACGNIVITAGPVATTSTTPAGIHASACICAGCYHRLDIWCGKFTLCANIGGANAGCYCSCICGAVKVEPTTVATNCNMFYLTGRELLGKKEYGAIVPFMCQTSGCLCSTYWCGGLCWYDSGSSRTACPTTNNPLYKLNGSTTAIITGACVIANGGAANCWSQGVSYPNCDAGVNNVDYAHGWSIGWNASRCFKVDKSYTYVFNQCTCSYLVVTWLQ